MTKTFYRSRAFDDAWFDCHQEKLLWLANNRFTRRWFRWVLRIRKHDDGHKSPIVKLAPNHYIAFKRWLDDGKVEIVGDFRTHAKYAKRIYYAFQPFWWALHFWDWLVAERFAPKLSFGFPTLGPVFPDAGDPGTNTIDGYCSVSGFSEQSWAALIGNAGNFHDSTVDEDIGGCFIWSGGTSNTWIRMARGFYHFLTSGIGAGNTVSAATFSIWGTAKQDGLSATPDMTVVQSNAAAANALADSDYANTGSTQFATPITYAGWSTTGYNDFALNASGLAAISLTGVTKLATRNANYDLAAVSPTWVASVLSSFSGRYADFTGTANDPKLSVTYSASGPAMVARCARFAIGRRR